ncbi:mitochondrial ribosomal protein S23 [Oratosquilla oratoria]|uniref:mitochondrial ribosomal protein S23 n=1 Tax=Oratosquilla oratoria TaxID=337810 RepID=UPI003F768470
MASSRLEKIGTIYTRVNGLLKSGAMKPKDKPLWYDIYEAFPPKYEPNYDRPVVNKNIPQILYHEDVIRAKFYKKYHSPGTIHLSEYKSRPSICQVFITEYQKLQADKCVAEEELMEKAALALEAHGIYLDPSRAPPKVEPVVEEKVEAASMTRPLREQVKLADIFKESQEEQKD